MMDLSRHPRGARLRVVCPVASGSATPEGGNETTLFSAKDRAAYEISVDLVAMRRGDIVTVRVYGKSRPSKGRELIAQQLYQDEQRSPARVLFASPLLTACQVTIQQTAGSLRAFDWGVRQLAA